MLFTLWGHEGSPATGNGAGVISFYLFNCHCSKGKNNSEAWAICQYCVAMEEKISSNNGISLILLKASDLPCRRRQGTFPGHCGIPDVFKYLVEQFEIFWTNQDSSSKQNSFRRIQMNFR